mgnify:CR=1 FL=1|jgi:hypothetical protein
MAIQKETPLSYIENKFKKKLYYHFTPAPFISNFSPLLIVFQDKEGSVPQDFEYKMWNVLIPKGPCIEDRMLLQELIEDLEEEYDCAGHIYCYGGDGMGYSAVLHGILADANAVFIDTLDMKLETSPEDILYTEAQKSQRFPLLYLHHEKQLKQNDMFLKFFNIKVTIDRNDDLDCKMPNRLEKVLDCLARMKYKNVE